MRTFVEAATGLPGILFTAALVVVVCFWLLVVIGVVAVDSFDADADLGTWSMGGVPVSVAVSLLTAITWLLDVGVNALLAVLAASEPAVGVLHLVASAGALFVSWRLTCLFVRPLHRLFPDEPVLPKPAEDIDGQRSNTSAATQDHAS